MKNERAKGIEAEQRQQQTGAFHVIRRTFVTGTSGVRAMALAAALLAMLGLASQCAQAAGVAATITVNAGNGQNATVNTNVTIAPSVTVTDSNSTTVVDGTPVTFTVSGGGLITGGTTTTMSGMATVASWMLGKVAGTNTLTVSCGSAPTLAITAAGVPDVPFKVAVVSSTNAQTATVATNVPQAPSVVVKDQYNNLVVNGTVVTYTLGAGGGQVSGASNTATTATANTVNGVASLVSWTMGTVSGLNTLSVTCGSVNPATITATATPDVATSLTINSANNQSAKVNTNVAAAPSVIAKDQYGNLVANNTSVTFTVATGNGTLNGGSASTLNGVALSGSWQLGKTAGTNTVYAICGQAAPLFFTATGTPDVAAIITVTAGNIQSALVNTSVTTAPSVLVTDQFGNKVVDNTSVTFAVASGAGSITGATRTTVNGAATLGGWKLGTVAGANSLTVSSSPAVMTVTATGTPDVAATIAINAGNNQIGLVNSLLAVPPSVIIKDQYKNTVADGTVATFSVFSGGGSVTGASALSINGVATVGSWKLGSVAGSNSLTVSTASLPALTFNAVAVPPAPTTIAINTGDAQSAVANNSVPVKPSVLVKDQQGNPITDGTVVTFAVVTGGGTITGGSATTINGIATLGSWTLGKNAGSNTLTATCAQLPAVTFTATAVADVPFAISASAGNAQSATIGTAVAIAPVVAVKDQYGNTVADGTLVSFAVASGGGSITGAVTNTLNGLATLGSWTVGSVPGANTLTVTSSNLPALTLTATAVPIAPASIAINAGNAQNAVVNTAVLIAPSVIVKDKNNALVPDGTVVTFAVASGGGAVIGGSATTTNGIATLTRWRLGIVSGANSLTVTCGPAPAATITATGKPDVPFSLVITNNNQNATVNTVLPKQPAATIKDQFGNLVADGTQVTFAVSGGGGTVLPATTATSNGVAAVSSWQLGATAGINTLSLTCAPLAVTTITAIGAPDVAANLAIVSGDAQSAKAGTAVAIAPSVKVTDQYGNVVVSGIPVTFSVASGGGSVTGGSATIVAGIATVGSWKLGAAGGANTLSVKCGTAPAITFNAKAFLPPVITQFSPSSNPAYLNGTTTYTFVATDAGATSLNYTLDFGDGTAAAAGTLVPGGIGSETHVFTSPSAGYTVTLTVSDTLSNVIQTLTQIVPAPTSGGSGAANISTGTNSYTHPITKLTIDVAASNGGVLQLGINGATGGDNVATKFNDANSADPATGEPGVQPVHKYVTDGIYIAETVVTNPVNGAVDQHGRKTIVIGANETTDPTAATGLPSHNGIVTKSLKGKFAYSGGSDTVVYTGSIALPPGLKTASTHDFSVAIGNIVGLAKIDANGNGAPQNQNGLSKVKLTFKSKKGALTAANDSATIAVTFTKQGLIKAGFDTEGINNVNVLSPLKIQVALLLDGVAYETLVPVSFISKKGAATCTISGPSKK